MAEAVEDLVTYLASEVGLVAGSSIRRWKLADQPARQVAVIPYGGTEPEEGFGVEGVKLERPRLQVVSRGAAGEDREALLVAQSCYHALAKIRARTVGSAFYHQAWPLQSPNNLGEDSNGRPSYGFNIQVERDLHP